MERDLRDVADGEGAGQPVAHHRVQCRLDEVRFPRWTGDLDAVETHGAASRDDLPDVDGVAEVAGDERSMEVDDHASGVGEGERLADACVVTRGRFGSGALVAERLEPANGVGVVGTGHEDVEVGERPQRRIRIGLVGQDSRP